MNTNPGGQGSNLLAPQRLPKFAPRRLRMLAVVLPLALAFSGMLAVQRAFSQPLATTITVNSTSNGTGGPDCKLRDAISAANSASLVGGCDGSGGGPFIIELASVQAYILKIVDNNDPDFGPNGLPVVESDITINGHSSQIVREYSEAATPAFRIFYISYGASLTLDDVLLVGGGGQGIDGGAISNNGTFRLLNSVMKFSRGTRGGGIQNTGRLVIDHSTLAYNVGGCGGAIDSDVNTFITVTNSLLANNTAYT